MPLIKAFAGNRTSNAAPTAHTASMHWLLDFRAVSKAPPVFSMNSRARSHASSGSSAHRRCEFFTAKNSVNNSLSRPCRAVLCS